MRTTPRPSTAANPLAQLRRTDPELREVVLRVREWGLAEGTGVSSDALTAAVGVAIEEARRGLASPMEWSTERVEELLDFLAPAFCDEHGADCPEDLADALNLWLRYLSAMGLLRRPERRRLRSAPWARHPAGRRGA